MHMIPQQVFNATLLGVVLGLIAIRSNSLLPGVVFHFVFNSIAVMRERVGKQLTGGHAKEFQQSVWHWFVTLEDGGVRYTWLTLVVAGIAASLSLHWVWQSGRIKTASEPITNLLACCLFGAGYTDDFNQSKAIVAVRTHSLAVA